MKKAETKDRLKEAMEIREIKQSELVEKTGIDKGQMSSYLSGKYKPKQGNLERIANALFVDEAWLMGYDVPMERITSTKEKSSKIMQYYEQLNDIATADVGRRIKEQREAIGMTQGELAKKLGYKNKSTIGKIETGINDIVLSKLVEFANALQTSVAYLMGWNDEEQPKEEPPKIMQYYELLNDIGKHKATEQVKILTEVPRYLKEDSSYVNAAHADDYMSASEELKQLEEDIMDDENF